MGTQYIPIDVKALEIGSANTPELVRIDGTNGPEWGYALSKARRDLYHRMKLPLYASGDLSFYIDWYSRSGSTSGAAVLGVRIAAITPGDSQSVESKNWATAATTTTTVLSTAKGLNSTLVTVTALDSLAAMDRLWINFYRDGTNGSDTMSGDVIFDTIMLAFSDT